MAKTPPFAAILRRLRERAGLTPAQLATKARISRAMAYALESGKRAATIDTARKLCKALGCSLAEFD